MKPLLCNLKSSHDLREMLEYKKIMEALDYPITLCPSAVFIPVMHSKKYDLCSQDIASSDEFKTGEISGKSLKSLGVGACLIGHVDLKNRFEDKILKLQHALKYQMKVYFLLSDTKQDSDYQYTSEKIMGQIRAVLSKVSRKDYKRIVFVYEPSWLADQGVSLDIDMTEKIFQVLKETMEQELQFVFPLYYGGGLNKKNLKPFIESSVIDGLLIGKFSKNPKEFVDYLASIE